MFYSAPTIKDVARFLQSLQRLPPLIVDPVLVSSSGKPLLQPNALRALMDQLFPLAALLTPNIPEAEVLGDLRIRKQEDLVIAARALHGRFGCAVLLKGGHLAGAASSTDVFYDGKRELLLSAQR